MYHARPINHRTPKAPAHTGKPYIDASQSTGRNITLASSVFIWMRQARSKPGCPLIAGAFTPYRVRALPTSHKVANCSNTLSKVTRAGRCCSMGVQDSIRVAHYSLLSCPARESSDRKISLGVTLLGRYRRCRGIDDRAFSRGAYGLAER